MAKHLPRSYKCGQTYDRRPSLYTRDFFHDRVNFGVYLVGCAFAGLVVVAMTVG